jgi:hypothetical protein
VHHIRKTRATNNHIGCINSKRAMERMGMKERAKDYYYAILLMQTFVAIHNVLCSLIGRH